MQRDEANHHLRIEAGRKDGRREGTASLPALLVLLFDCGITPATFKAR